jgi:beta-lactamase superfamily II metal-dependent hydrolase
MPTYHWRRVPLRIEIFDVEHGACALLTADNGNRMMIDCGHRTSPLWLPGQTLQNRRITTLEYLYVTNYDEDHVSGLGDLLGRVNVQWIFRNASVSPQIIQRLKTEDGMGPGIERLVQTLTYTHTLSSVGALLPPLPGVTVSTFHNTYPAFEDENNLSLIVHLDCFGVGIMFTGDMETAGFAPLLTDPAFVDRLKRTSVFVAPHHGRVSGCCDDVAKYCKPYYVVVSDKSHMYESQQTHDHYHAMAIGGKFRGRERHVLTTRNDGAITIDISAAQWNIG